MQPPSCNWHLRTNELETCVQNFTTFERTVALLSFNLSPAFMEDAHSPDEYLALWNGFKRDVLIPATRRRFWRSEYFMQAEMTAEHFHVMFDNGLYHFTYNQVTMFLEDLCDKFFHRVDSDTSTSGCLEQVNTFFDRLTKLHNRAISPFLGKLERVYVVLSQDPEIYSPTPCETIIAGVIRNRLYYKLATRLRKEAFKSISDDLTVQDPKRLSSYFTLVKAIGVKQEVKFCTEEWDEPLLKKISMKLNESVSKWNCGTLTEFLETVEAYVQGCGKIFMFFEGSTKESVMKEIGKARDLLVFGNDSKELKNMFFDAGYDKTLKHLFDLFHNDKKFLNTVAYHSLMIYCDLIYRDSEDLGRDLFKKETTVKTLLFIWTRIRNILMVQNMKRTAVYVAFVRSFKEVTVYAVKYPETTTKVLCRFFCAIISTSTNGHHRLNQSSMEKLLAISSLNNFLFATGHFSDVLRVLLSKFLLRFSASDIDTSKLFEQNSIGGQNHTTWELSALLKDACNWDSYRSEMIPMTRTLQGRYGIIQIDPRIVRRSIWDLGPDIGFGFPKNMQNVSESIIETFQSLYPTRSVSIHSLAGEMIIRSNIWKYHGNVVRISLSTGQWSVLTRLGCHEISFKELYRKLLVNVNEPLGFPALVAILKTFVTDYPIVKKKPENTNFCETDTFSLNLEFQPTSAFIGLPVPGGHGERDGKNMNTGLNHFAVLDMKQIVRATVVSLLKHERKLEMSQMRDMVVDRLSMLYDLTEVDLEEVLGELESEEYITVDKSTVEYVV